jgi:hypothetical protein
MARNGIYHGWIIILVEHGDGTRDSHDNQGLTGDERKDDGAKYGG